MFNESQTVRSVPIEMVQGDIDSVTERIHSGKAVLKVVAYPWGVEFDVCELSFTATDRTRTTLP
jgi:hypothetical protein